MKIFNKKIRLMDIDTGSLVWIEFGETKHIFPQILSVLAL